jgi:hypothetical protein
MCALRQVHWQLSFLEDKGATFKVFAFQFFPPSSSLTTTIMSTSSLLARSQQRKQRHLQENVTPSSPAPASTSLPPAGGMTPGGSLGVKSSPNPFSNTSSYNMFPPPTCMGLPLIAQLKNFGERTLKQIKLSDESEAEFKRYLEVRMRNDV